MLNFQKAFENPKLTNTAGNQRMSFSENPKVANTAWSRTLRRLTLHGVLPASVLPLLALKENLKK